MVVIRYTSMKEKGHCARDTTFGVSTQSSPSPFNAVHPNLHCNATMPLTTNQSVSSTAPKMKRESERGNESESPLARNGTAAKQQQHSDQQLKDCSAESSMSNGTPTSLSDMSPLLSASSQHPHLQDSRLDDSTSSVSITSSQNGCPTNSESFSSYVQLSSPDVISRNGHDPYLSTSSSDHLQHQNGNHYEGADEDRDPSPLADTDKDTLDTWTSDITSTATAEPLGPNKSPQCQNPASNSTLSECMTSENGHQVRGSPSQSPCKKRFSQTRELELSIPLYYAGKNIFITGATGFIGKVFIEKLLRSCPEVAGIYCLIRPKNNQTIQQRLEELVDSKLFDGLRRDQPDFFSKLHPVEGDVLLPNLGLSPEDTKTLEECINLVFHSAATVRFDEPLRKAVEMNVLAVRKMLNLCRNFQHLEAFVHVSTAYANCDISYIEEKVYAPPVDPQKIIDVLSWMDDEMVDLFTPKLIGEKPNTYTYTKQLAEHLLVTEGADLPLAIVRPSIVGAAWREPFPGWIDNFNGPSGIYIAAGKGILRWMKADTNAVADIVPVDIPVNIMIAVGWYTAVAKPKSVHIYHATTGSTNPFRWGEMGVVVNKSFKQNPLEKCFRRPKVALTNNTFLTDYSKIVSHLCPAYLCDMALALIGRKPRMVKLYNKLHNSIDALQFFTCREWQWETTNMEILRRQLTPDDLRMFYFDIRPLHWPTYIENYCLGAKKYVLNEDLSGLPAARAHIRKLRIIRMIFNSAICAILWRVLIAKSQFARNLWFFIVSLVFKFVRFFRITSTMNK